MPAAMVLSGSEGAADRLRAVYDLDGKLTDADVVRTTAAIEAAGGRDRTVAEARRRLDAVLDSVVDVGLVDSAVEELAGLARFVAEREV